MLKHFVAVVAFVSLASGAPARGAQPEQRPSQPAVPAAQRDQQVQARYNIFVMEGVLERAVSHGADSLRRQVRRVMPDMLLLSGEAQARGFRLDGYGVFFDVAVPVMRQSVAWHLRTMVQESSFGASSALQQLRAAIERMTPDGGEKAMLLQAIKRLEFQVGVPPPQGPAMTAAQRSIEPGSLAAGVAGTVPGAQPAAQSATQPGTVTAMTAPPGQQAAPALSADDAALLEDPNGAYEREVIGALVDAMLNHSGSIGIGPDEWLTVAAHDNEQRNRLMPGDPYDLLTIVLRMKGSDLAAFRADRLTREEARKRVLISEY